ncbi:aminotransferase class V-fold PLP-dependent enzyme [Candidatus Dojkabacteria bacterium]|uniref:Aminotransferase class V-fold PLP-dependent enzyme n=1 Tax=Candidatus Dojkabacteria bacterium TaxID=2099670 RepID=A0A955KWY9_9BACT|nr:aminotransferase class V-fold PLP-dependent enzyme [Candidatus Dojkabacteria bacterium]
MADPEIIEAISSYGIQQFVGYGDDQVSNDAKDLIRNAIGMENIDIHFIPGGTHVNLITIDSILTQSYMSVLAVESGHINVHEAGAIEATGHKITYVPSRDGKMIIDEIDNIMELHKDEHMVLPQLVYISQTTELGTVYSRAELKRLRDVCDKWGLYLFVDGARLGSALTSPVSDIDLGELASLADVFYIGATKNGGMLGEALVIVNDTLKKDFRRNIKMRGGLMAKGIVLSIQFKVLFTGSRYLDHAQHANDMAQKLSEGISELGYSFMTPPVSNQIFPVFSDELISKLSGLYGFYVWRTEGDGKSSIRLVTSWATPIDMVEAFLDDLKLYTS